MYSFNETKFNIVKSYNVYYISKMIGLLFVAIKSVNVLRRIELKKKKLKLVQLLPYSIKKILVYLL